ncbi:MAG: hypothetical protein MSS66_09735 [Selenomonadaceae bacterium]|nr:hypothetical protein [Selenomonadaceae bacterium]
MMVESFMSIAGACALAKDESFLSFIEEDGRVTACSDIEASDCFITVECDNVADLEDFTNELKQKYNILTVGHNVVLKPVSGVA